MDQLTFVSKNKEVFRNASDQGWYCLHEHIHIMAFLNRGSKGQVLMKNHVSVCWISSHVFESLFVGRLVDNYSYLWFYFMYLNPLSCVQYPGINDAFK